MQYLRKSAVWCESLIQIRVKASLMRFLDGIQLVLIQITVSQNPDTSEEIWRGGEKISFGLSLLDIFILISNFNFIWQKSTIITLAPIIIISKLAVILL